MNILGKMKSKNPEVVFPGWRRGRVWWPRFWSHAERKTGTGIFVYSGSCFPPTVRRKGHRRPALYCHWENIEASEQCFSPAGAWNLAGSACPVGTSAAASLLCRFDIHPMQGGAARQWSWCFARSCSADGWPSRDEPASATGRLLHLKVCSGYLLMSWPASSFSLNLHLWESELSCECGLFLNWSDKIMFYWHFFSA